MIKLLFSFPFFVTSYFLSREHSSVGRDMHCYMQGEPDTPLIHLKKSEFQPLGYLTKKTSYFLQNEVLCQFLWYKANIIYGFDVSYMYNKMNVAVFYFFYNKENEYLIDS